MAELLSEHLAKLKPEVVKDEGRLRFFDCGPESDSDSGLDEIFKGPIMQPTE